MRGDHPQERSPERGRGGAPHPRGGYAGDHGEPGPDGPRHSGGLRGGDLAGARAGTPRGARGGLRPQGARPPGSEASAHMGLGDLRYHRLRWDPGHGPGGHPVLRAWQEGGRLRREVRDTAPVDRRGERLYLSYPPATVGLPTPGGTLAVTTFRLRDSRI